MSKKKIPTIIIEKVITEENMGLFSLLEHKDHQYLVIVDNITSEELFAYVLDYAESENINTSAFISIASSWAKNHKHPLSFELSMRGIHLPQIYKTFDLAYITRLIGCPFSFNTSEPEKIRRRKALYAQNFPIIER